MAMTFEWHEEKAKTNEAKHGVGFDEAKSVFNDSHSLTTSDESHSEVEERWLELGLSSFGRLLVVWYTKVTTLSESLEHVLLQPRKETFMSNPANNDEMLSEYDFSNAEQGKHYQAYRAGHTVRVFKADGSVQQTYFTLADGAVMIDPDLHAKFPTSESVNAALRSLVSG